MAWLETAVVILLPWAVRTYLNRQRLRVSSPGPSTTSRVDKALSMLLGLTLLACTLPFWFPPTDLFGDLQVPLNIPAYQLRYRLQQHLVLVHGLPPSTAAALLERPAHQSARSTHDATATSVPERLVNVFHIVRYNDAARRVYSLYGESGLTSCDYCTLQGNEQDYWTYFLPQMLAPYVGALVVIGIMTSTHKWAHWRSTLALTVIGVLTLELLVRFDMVSLLMLVQTFGLERFLRPDLVYRSMVSLQAMIGIVAVLLLYWFPKPLVLTPTDVILQELMPLLKATEKLTAVQQQLHLCTLVDPTLRSHYQQHEANMGSGMERLFNDAELKRAREAALRQPEASQLDPIVRREVDMLLPPSL